jgi:nicotine blue oxidoreductase
LRSILVLGAHACEIQRYLNNDCWSQVRVCQNWESGMRASIQSGFEAAFVDAQEHNANLQGSLLCLVDQPMIRIKSLERLVRLGMQDQRITCAGYADSPGPPAYFPRNEMEEFCVWNSGLASNSLESGGAKPFILTRPYQALTFEDQELVDIDTHKALMRVRESFTRKKRE